MLIEQKQKQIIKEFMNELSVVDKNMRIEIGMRNEYTGKFMNFKPPLYPYEAFAFLKQENAIWKNRNGGENYYWKPAKSDMIRVLFVDDPQVQNMSNVYLKVQTSQGKQQFLFVLTTPVAEKEAQKIQKELVVRYKADKGATSLYHFRRIPGLFNMKMEYEEPFMIVFEKYGNMLNPLCFFKEEAKIDTPKFSSSSLSLTRREAKKSWQDFYTGDYSQTDMKFAVYLLSIGYTEQEVIEELKRQSPELIERKGANYVGRYLAVTVQKAASYVKRTMEF